MSANECPRPERVDTIGTTPRAIEIAATSAECAALAHRFGLRRLDSLSATLRLWRDATGIIAQGQVHAAVVQACVVTDDSVNAVIDEPMAVRFVSADALAPSEEEVELSSDALDTILYSGGVIDLGEAAAETMALALDPFPRASGAAAVLEAAGVVSEDRAAALDTPFGALAALKNKLGSEG